VSVRIDGSDLVITGTGVKELRVKPGAYRVVANKDGRVVQQELVRVERNGQRVFRVTRETVSAKTSDKSLESLNRKPAAEALAASARKEITNSIGMNLVLIPAGEFLIGSPDSDQDASAGEKPQHLVRITRPFYLGATEVTVGQFRRFVERTGFRTEAETEGKGGWGWDEAKQTYEQDPKYTWRNPGFAQTDEHPVVNVSWNDAIACCNKLSELEGLKPCRRPGGAVESGGDGYRLPTEAEWKYACRAGSTTRYSFGDDAGNLGEFAWYGDNSGVKTHPVGQKRPNVWGLYDMHGNVWEWCEDGWDANYYQNSPGANPAGLSQTAFRVYRGGAWDCLPRFAQSATRFGPKPEIRYFHLGFRLARVQSSR
jgi:formylglycine-generating enzyme required for sulfatase activity